MKKRELTKGSVILRVASIILFIYIFVWVNMFVLTGMISGSIFEGVQWSSGGAGTLFPIPSYPGILAIMTPANPVDTFIFLLFLESYLWIPWLVVTFFYSISPYTLNRNS